MIIIDRISGTTVDLRSANPSDAEFTIELRQDPVITRFLPRVEHSVEEQIEWINASREKENEYFFIICNKKGERLGTISVYDIKDDHAESGRLASFGNPVENMEAILLNMDFAFNRLGLEYVLANTMVQNTKVVKINEKFGTVFTGKHTDERGFEVIHGRLYKDAFNSHKPGIQKMINKAAQTL